MQRKKMCPRGNQIRKERALNKSEKSPSISRRFGPWHKLSALVGPKPLVSQLQYFARHVGIGREAGNCEFTQVPQSTMPQPDLVLDPKNVPAGFPIVLHEAPQDKFKLLRAHGASVRSHTFVLRQRALFPTARPTNRQREQPVCIWQPELRHEFGRQTLRFSSQSLFHVAKLVVVLLLQLKKRQLVLLPLVLQRVLVLLPLVLQRRGMLLPLSPPSMLLLHQVERQLVVLPPGVLQAHLRGVLDALKLCGVLLLNALKLCGVLLLNALKLCGGA